MICPDCNIEMEEIDSHSVMTFMGNYLQPPEYEVVWVKYYCHHCGEFKTNDK